MPKLPPGACRDLQRYPGLSAYSSITTPPLSATVADTQFEYRRDHCNLTQPWCLKADPGYRRGIGTRTTPVLRVRFARERGAAKPCARRWAEAQNLRRREARLTFWTGFTQATALGLMVRPSSESLRMLHPGLQTCATWLAQGGAAHIARFVGRKPTHNLACEHEHDVAIGCPAAELRTPRVPGVEYALMAKTHGGRY